MANQSRPPDRISTSERLHRRTHVNVSRQQPQREALMLLPECAAVLGFLAIIWTCIGMILSQQHQSAERGAVRDTRNLARAFEENTERIVASVDQTLLSLRADYADDPNGFDLQAWLARSARADRFSIQVAISDPNGLATQTSLGGRLRTPIDISDREHFRVQRDSTGDELFISKPVLGRASHEWTVQFTRKLVLKDGSFGGILVLSLGCNELSRFYETLDLGHGFVLLLGEDGFVRARGPLREGVIGKDLSHERQFDLMRTAAHGDFVAVASSDGIERMISFRHLRDQPLLVLVGLATEDVFDSYRQTRARALLTGGMASAIVLFLGTFWIVRRRRWIASRQALQVTLDSISQGIVMVDASGQAPVINRRAAELLDLSAQALARPQSIDWPSVAAGGGTGTEAAGRADLPTRETLTQIARADGKTIEVQASPTQFGGAVFTYTDVTERKLAQAQILHMAHHDALTGLPNRLLLLDRITETVEQIGPRSGQFGVFRLNVEGFRTINETMGHDFGDIVLSRFADRLRALVRPGDTVAHTGGDEFAVLVRGLGAEATAEHVANRLLHDLPVPIEIGGYRLDLGSRIGIALFPEDGSDGRTLLKNADTALYHAKTGQDAGFRRFETWMDQSLGERRALERDLRAAVETNQLVVHFQPQFACDTLVVTGFEALARWPHPARGLVPPGVFIPLAEECGLIAAIGRFVLEQACTQAAEWRPRCRIAVNLSPVQFRDSSLLPWLAGILQRTGLPPDLLELEITEGVLIKDEEQALATLQALKDLGVPIALDDFGTGYSSLSYLRRFPFDAIKIDKSFIHAQQQDFATRAIVEAVLAMSQRLHLRVIAEGVETEDQLTLLREQGSTDVQGFLLARPMPGAEVQAFLASMAGSAAQALRQPAQPPAAVPAEPAGSRQRRRSDR
jgi:diguanylate cyclase (GGDEF)-like protein